MRPIHPIIEQANAAFPNLEVELGDAELNRSIISRRIGQYAVTHLKMPAIAVQLIGQRAVDAGLGNHLKLMWQLTGRTRYEASGRKFDIAPGELVVTSMAEDYRLEMLEGHEALILIFDPADDPKWPELARDALTIVPLIIRSPATKASKTVASPPTDVSAGRRPEPMSLVRTESKPTCMVSP